MMPTPTPKTPPPARTHRAPGHFWADNELIDAHLPDIGVYAFAVYMFLARYAGNQTGRCDPSIETIAYKLDISAPTVKKALNTLEQHGLILCQRRVIKRGTTWINLTNVYTLLAVAKQTGQKLASFSLQELDDLSGATGVDHTLPVPPIALAATRDGQPYRPELDSVTAQVSKEITQVGSVAIQVGSVTTQGGQPDYPGVGKEITQVGSVTTQGGQPDYPGVGKEITQVGKEVATIKTPRSILENPPPPPPTPPTVTMVAAGDVLHTQKGWDADQIKAIAARIKAGRAAPTSSVELQTIPNSEHPPVVHAAAPAPAPAPAAPPAPATGEAIDTERDALLCKLGVRSSKARQSLGQVALQLISAWQQVLGDPTLVAGLEAHGIADPVAFAVSALRDGNGPPDTATLRRWLKPAGAGTPGGSGQDSGIRNISTVSPEEWAAMSQEERHALIAAQALRVNWRVANP